MGIRTSRQSCAAFGPVEWGKAAHPKQWYANAGRVSAVFGTHTHVGTVDARILPKGTGYLTDVGMTGPVNSVIGSDTGPVLERFLTGMPQRLVVASGPVTMNSVLVDVDPDSGKALSIQRVDRTVD